MENTNYNLEEMRSDYQALKDTLAKQEIINDKLLRETMKNKVGSIMTRSKIAIVCGIFVMVMAPIIFHFNPAVNASWWFIAATEVLMAFCILKEIEYTHKVEKTDLSDCDLLTFSKDVKRLKDRYKGWIKWGIILGSAWLVWLVVEVLTKSDNPTFSIALIVGLLIGFGTGALIGMKMNRKVISTCDDIISNIEEQ